MHQHINRAAPLLTKHINGESNRMADFASRSFCDSAFTNTNKSFLEIFSQHFPLPQKTFWKECILPAEMCSKVISCLCGKPLSMELWTATTKHIKNTGNTEEPTPPPLKWTHSLIAVAMSKKSSLSQLLLQGSGQVTMAKAALSKFNLLLKHWQPSPIPLNWLENHP